MPPLIFVVDRREAGQTVAAVLKRRFGLSWSQAKRLIQKGHVKMCGQYVGNVAQRVKPGKQIELTAGTVELQLSKRDRPLVFPKALTPHPRSIRCVPKPISHLPIEIVYSDDAIVVVNKPPGLTTMRSAQETIEFGDRARKYLPRTLADWLPELLGCRGRPVIPVHRIDRDTSGLVVFARTRVAADNLSQQFRNHTVDRLYLALTRGAPQSRRIESRFVRDRGDGRRGSLSNPATGTFRRAVTHVRVLEHLGHFALVECRLETGRTHQVRIHLGETGTPLCGDHVYDRPLHGQPVPDGSGATRPMLHALRLGFQHPEGSAHMVWEVKPPTDFEQLLQRFRSNQPSPRT